MPKILITGCYGLIGKKVTSFLKKKHVVKAVDLIDGFDLTNEIQVKDFFKKNNNFNYLINLHGANEHIMKSSNKKKKS